jgi:hypothetical protein
MSLIDDLKILRNTLESIPIDLGDNRYKEISVVNRVQQGNTIVNKVTKLGKHKVTVTDLRTQEILFVREGIGRLIDLFIIKMPKNIDIDLFRKANRIYIEDKQFELRHVQDTHSVSYQLIVSRVQDSSESL